MTAPDPLDAIQARADAATEGPWDATGIVDDFGDWEYSEVRHDFTSPSGKIWPDQVLGTIDLEEADAEFIAHAREDVPKLVKALREVETIMDQLDIDRADGRIVMPSQIQQAVRETIRAALG